MLPRSLQTPPEKQSRMESVSWYINGRREVCGRGMDYYRLNARLKNRFLSAPTKKLEPSPYAAYSTSKRLFT